MISMIDDPCAGGNGPTGRTIKKDWSERDGQIQRFARCAPIANHLLKDLKRSRSWRA